MDLSPRPVVLFRSSMDDESAYRDVCLFFLKMAFTTWTFLTQRRNKTICRKLALLFHRLNKTTLDAFLADGNSASFELNSQRRKRFVAGGAGKRLQQEIMLTSNFSRANSLILEFLNKYDGKLLNMKDSVMFRSTSKLFIVWKQ